EVLPRALVMRALLAEAHELEAQLAELHLTAVHQVDDLLPLVRVLDVGAVRRPEVLDLPAARLPLAVRVVTGDGRLGDDDLDVRAAADRERRSIERDELADELR